MISDAILGQILGCEFRTWFRVRFRTGFSGADSGRGFGGDPGPDSRVRVPGLIVDAVPGPVYGRDSVLEAGRWISDVFSDPIPAGLSVLYNCLSFFHPLKI